MSDLVQRLRAAEYPSDWTGPRTEHEAADAIARLTYERDEWREADRAECAENARLRARMADMQGERDAAELERERQHLERLRWYERLAIAVGWKIRPREKRDDRPS